MYVRGCSAACYWCLCTQRRRQTGDLSWWVDGWVGGSGWWTVASYMGTPGQGAFRSWWWTVGQSIGPQSTNRSPQPLLRKLAAVPQSIHTPALPPTLKWAQVLAWMIEVAHDCYPDSYSHTFTRLNSPPRPHPLYATSPPQGQAPRPRGGGAGGRAARARARWPQPPPQSWRRRHRLPLRPASGCVCQCGRRRRAASAAAATVQRRRRWGLPGAS